MAFCAREDPWSSNNPEYALQALLSALNLGDHTTAREFLGPRTRQFLADNTQQRQEALGNPTPITPETDLLAGLFRVWTPATVEVERLETIERTEDHAVVQVHSVFGDQTEVRLDRTADRWTIELVDEPIATSE